MKNLFLLLLALPLILACSKDDDEKNKELDIRLVGTRWQREAMAAYYLEYNFLTQTEFEVYGIVLDRIEYTFRGTYKLSYPQLILKHKNIDNEDTETLFIFKNDSTMILESLENEKDPISICRKL